MKTFSHADIKQRLMRKQGEDVFIIDTIDNCRYTYEQFFQYVEKCIRILERNNLPQTVFISMNNCFCLAALYFACIAAGKTISPVDPNMTADEIKSLVNEIPDSIIITNKQGFIDNAFPSLNAEIFVSALKENGELSNAGVETFFARMGNVNLENPCLITYTSGTSGRPKGVMHNLNNLILSANAFMEHLNIDENNVFYHSMPMTYMAGILNTILLPFIAGSAIVITERFSVQEAVVFWNKVEETGANTFWFSPTMLAILDKMDNKSAGKGFCSSHKTLWLIGTAPLSISLKSSFEKKYNVELYQSYGLSETLFVTSVNSDSYSIDDAGVGTLLNDAKIEQREDGELLIGVPWMFLGYTNENTDSYYIGENYISGDIGYFSGNKLYITDRKKDLIIRGGINISPKAIETAALEVEGISEAVVFKGHSPMMGETVICAIIASPGQEHNNIKKDLLLRVKSMGTGYAIDKIVFVDSIPRNTNGKIDKKALEKLYDN